MRVLEVLQYLFNSVFPECPSPFIQIVTVNLEIIATANYSDLLPYSN